MSSKHRKVRLDEMGILKVILIHSVIWQILLRNVISCFDCIFLCFVKFSDGFFGNCLTNWHICITVNIVQFINVDVL